MSDRSRRVLLVLVFILPVLYLGFLLWLKDVRSRDNSAANDRLRLGLNAARGKLADHAGIQVADPWTASGDALTDAYGQLVLARIGSPETRDNLDLTAAAPDVELAALEAQFGGESRYWELRYACGKVRERKGVFSAEGFQTPVDFLREARRRKAASANTLLLLYGEGAEADPPADAAAQQALLAEVVTTWPDSAWGHYLLAIELYAAGDAPGARAALAEGNAAGDPAAPLAFPASALNAALVAGGMLGNRRVTGAVDALRRFADTRQQLTFQRDARKLLEDGNPGLAELTAWLHCAARVSSGRESDLLSQAGAYNMVRAVATAGLRRPDLSAAQRANLLRLNGAAEALKAIHRKAEFDAVQTGLEEGARFGPPGVLLALAGAPAEAMALQREAQVVYDHLLNVDLRADTPAPALQAYPATALEKR
jgi:hypothetical protein